LDDDDRVEIDFDDAQFDMPNDDDFLII